jgi:phage terminase large subunit GpA-like protein
LALDDGETAMQPARRPEHWGTLLKQVIWRRYPVAGDPDKELSVMSTSIDTGGLEGVTDNASTFWWTAIRAGVPPTALMLIQGGNNPKGRLLPPPTIDVKRKGAKGDPDPELFLPNVNQIKDIINVRIRREAGGAGYMALPRNLEPKYLRELTAETKIDGIWTKKPGEANETLDLFVYSIAGMLRLGGSDTGLEWVPAWARPRPGAKIQTKTVKGTGRRRRGGGLGIRVR